MYRTGHLGVSLLLYAPVGLVLVASGQPDLAILGEVGMVSLAMLPDADHDLPGISHRGSTHTVAFALLVGGILGTVGWVLDGQPASIWASEIALFGFGIGTFAIVAHLVGDLLTPMGITPFWPVWTRNFTLGVTRADNTIANYALLGLGVFVTAVVVITA